MLSYLRGNIFDGPADAYRVNPVNCQGVAGAGLALRFKHRFPESHDLYTMVCLQKNMLPGRPLFDHRFRVIQFPTKDRWKDPSELKWIRDGLLIVASWLSSEAPRTLLLPRLGCGLGGLDWLDVYPMIEEILDVDALTKHTITVVS